MVIFRKGRTIGCMTLISLPFNFSSLFTRYLNTIIVKLKKLVFYHDKNRKIPPVGVIYDPSIDKKVNSAKIYFPKLLRYDRACSTVGQTKPEIYVIVGKKKAVWTSVVRGKPERFEVSLRPGQITSGVERKLSKLCLENIQFTKDIIIGNHPQYSFLFKHIDLDKEFVELLDQLKISLVQAMITNKSVIKLIKTKFNLSSFKEIDITEQQYFHNIVIAVADTIILRTLLEKFIEVNFNDIDEKLEMKINELEGKVNQAIGKDIGKDTLEILREGRMKTLTSFFQIDDSYMESLKEKDRLYQEYQGGDFFNSVISSVITDIIQILGKNYSALIQSLISSGRYNFRYEDLSIEVLQEFYERSLHKVIQITNDEKGKLKVAVNNSKEAQRAAGAFFTPSELCDKMITLSLYRYVNKQIQTPLKNCIDQLDNTTSRKEIFVEIESLLKKLLNIKICDPSMGAGVFLRSAFNSLTKLFSPITELIENIMTQYPDPAKNMLDTLDATFLGSNDSDFNNQSRWQEYILKNMLYGVDFDIRAVYIASQVLTLSSLKIIKNGQHFPTFVNLNLKQGNSLISPISLNSEDSQWLSRNHKETILEVIRIRNEIKKTQDYNQIQNMLGRTRDSIHDITTKLVKQRLIKVKAGKGEKVFTEEQLLDRRLMPFVWQLEFPELFFDNSGIPLQNPGFTLVIGNPPWEKWKAYDYQWLSAHQQVKKRAGAKKKVAILLKKKPELISDYENHKNFYKAPSLFFKARYKFRGRVGDINLYKLFMELFYSLSGNMYAYVVPGSVLGDKGGRELRQMMIEESKAICFLELISSRDTEEKRGFFSSIFPGSVILVAVLEKYKTTDVIMFKTNIRKFSQLNFNEDRILHDIDEGGDINSIASKYNIILLKKADIAEHSKEFVIPIYGDYNELSVVRKMYKYPTLGDPDWNCGISSGLHVTNERDCFVSTPTSIPVIEGKYMMRFGYSTKKLTRWLDETKKSRFKLLGKNFVAWRSISPKARRRMMKVIFVTKSERIALTNSIFTITDLPQQSQEYLCGIMNSIPFEFRIRQTTLGANISKHIIEKMPVPLFDHENRLHVYLSEKVGFFRETANRWADEKMMSDGEENIDQIGDLRYKSELTEFDALSALIYGLNLGEFKQTLNVHVEVDSEYKREAIKQYCRLIDHFGLGNEYNWMTLV